MDVRFRSFYSYWTIYKSAIQQLSPALLTRKGSYWFETENALTANLRLLDFMSIQFFIPKPWVILTLNESAVVQQSGCLMSSYKICNSTI
jgi:hypothetical protein